MLLAFYVVAFLGLSPICTLSRRGHGMPAHDHFCDDGQTGVANDFMMVEERLWTCQGPTMPSNTELKAVVEDKCYKIERIGHYCVGKTHSYVTDPPLSGLHREVWPVYGEYSYLPAPRYLHSLEHGGIVMLYNPCAPADEVNRLKRVVSGCLRRHVITPYVNLSTPMAVLSWGCILRLNRVDEVAVQTWIRRHAFRTGQESLVYNDGVYTHALKSVARVVSDMKDTTLCPRPASSRSQPAAAVTGATVTGAAVTGATVTGAAVTGAAVTGATVTGAAVTGATVTRAAVTRAAVTGATVTGATVTGATGTGATGTTVQSSTVQSSTVQSSTVQSSTVQSSTSAEGTAANTTPGSSTSTPLSEEWHAAGNGSAGGIAADCRNATLHHCLRAVALSRTVWAGVAISFLVLVLLAGLLCMHQKTPLSWCSLWCCCHHRYNATSQVLSYEQRGRHRQPLTQQFRENLATRFVGGGKPPSADYFQLQQNEEGDDVL